VSFHVPLAFSRMRVVPGHHARSHKTHLFNTPFLSFLCFRIANALIVRTFFNADEYYQGPEVAHALAYGYGVLTWEWSAKLRTYAHPLVYYVIYIIGDRVGARSGAFTRLAPRFAHAVVAAAHDVGCGRLARRLFGSTGAKWTTFARVFSWFAFFCETRSFVNCLEGACVTWALTYWPFDALGERSGGASRRIKALTFAAMACALRPTSAMIWLPLGLRTLGNGKDGVEAKLRFVFYEVVVVAAAAMFLSASVDRYFYGEWVCVACNFIKFNVLKGGSAMYGAHAWHWYVTQGYPAVMGTTTPLALLGFWRHRRTRPEPFLVTFWTIAGYSIAAHKEFRFLLPCLGASLTSVGSVLATMRPGRQRVVAMFIVVTNVVAAAYTSVWHQAGTIAVMPHIAALARDGKITDGGVLFATPCHQTPFYSHVHREIEMRRLECDPRDDGSVDASARFAENPGAYFTAEFGSSPRAHATRSCAVAAALAPSRIVIFDGDARRATEWLSAWNFTLEKSFHHAHFAVDREIQRRVELYARSFEDHACAPPQGS